MAKEVMKLGFLVPGVNCILEPEVYKIAPEGVSAHFERLIVAETPQRDITSKTGSVQMLRMLDDLGKDARRAAKVVATVHPRVIAFGCTSGSFFKGIEYDKELIKGIEVETNIPAITASTAVVQALEELGLRRVCLVSPYPDYLNEKARDFLEASGFKVPIMKGLSCKKPEEAMAHPPEVAYNLAKSVYDTSCDGVFCSCTAFRTVEILDRFEIDVGKPMISANQAIMWLALKTAGVRGPVVGFGELLRHL